MFSEKSSFWTIRGWQLLPRTLEALDRMAALGPVRIGRALRFPEFAFVRSRFTDQGPPQEGRVTGIEPWIKPTALSNIITKSVLRAEPFMTWLLTKGGRPTFEIFFLACHACACQTLEVLLARSLTG